MIEKKGPEIVSLLHNGHLPGLVSLALFAKENPHFLHSAGETMNVNLLVWTVF